MPGWGPPPGGPPGCKCCYFMCEGIRQLIYSGFYLLCCCCIVDSCCGPVFGGPPGPPGPSGPGGRPF